MLLACSPNTEIKNMSVDLVACYQWGSGHIPVANDISPNGEGLANVR